MSTQQIPPNTCSLLHCSSHCSSCSVLRTSLQFWWCAAELVVHKIGTDTISNGVKNSENLRENYQ